MMTEDINPGQSSFKDMMKEVERIIESVGSESVDLDQLVIQVEKGYELIQKMQTKLDDTKLKIEKLKPEKSFVSDES